MTGKGEEEYRNSYFCRFSDTVSDADKVKDDLHLTGKYRGPAARKCNIIVTPKQSNFIPFVLHKFSN